MFAICVFTMAFGASAQSVTADFTKMDQLLVKLSKAIEKAPKDCGEPDVDAYVNGAKVAGLGAVASAEKLHNFYSRQIGETQDGVTAVTESKPTLEDWIELGVSVSAQTAGLAVAGDAAAKATEAVKKAPKMKAIGMSKSVKWSTDIYPVIGEALAEQTKAIDEIIKTLKSGNNL